MRDQSGPIGVVTALIRAAFLVNGAYADVGRELGVTPQQGQLLSILRSKAYGMTELSTALGLAKSTTTGLVDGIARRGFAIREQGAQDSRSLQVLLTDEGRAVADAFYARVRQRIEAVLQPLDADEQATVAGLIGRCVTAGPVAMIFVDEPAPADAS